VRTKREKKGNGGSGKIGLEERLCSDSWMKRGTKQSFLCPCIKCGPFPTRRAKVNILRGPEAARLNEEESRAPLGVAGKGERMAL